MPLPQVIAIVKIHKDPNHKEPKTHAKNFEKNSPLCGGGKNASKNKTWQTVAGGHDAINCTGCLKKLIKLTKLDQEKQVKIQKKRAKILKQMEMVQKQIAKLEAEK